jgi:hypothetical protein
MSIIKIIVHKMVNINPLVQKIWKAFALSDHKSDKKLR